MLWKTRLWETIMDKNIIMVKSKQKHDYIKHIIQKIRLWINYITTEHLNTSQELTYCVVSYKQANRKHVSHHRIFFSINVTISSSYIKFHAFFAQKG